MKFFSGNYINFFLVAVQFAMEESEDVRFAEVNCLEEGSEELCKGQSYGAGTRYFPGYRQAHFLFRIRIRPLIGSGIVKQV
jgi:hypothetical protein